MAEDFRINSMKEWEESINVLSEAREAMDFASEKMKAVVQDCLLKNGITGDLVPVLMERYDEDVLGSIKIFDSCMGAFIKTNQQVLENSEELDKTLNTKVSQMSISRDDLLNGGGR